MIQKLKLIINEDGGMRDATPSEIIAWHQLECMKSMECLCTEHSECEGCPAEYMSVCNSDIDACEYELDGKEITLKVVGK